MHRYHTTNVSNVCLSWINQELREIVACREEEIRAAKTGIISRLGSHFVAGASVLSLAFTVLLDL